FLRGCVSYFTLRTSLILKEPIKDLYKRLMKAAAAPVGTPWMWALAFGQHEDPTHGYGALRFATRPRAAQGETRITGLLYLLTNKFPTGRSAALGNPPGPRRTLVEDGIDALDDVGFYPDKPGVKRFRTRLIRRTPPRFCVLKACPPRAIQRSPN